MVISNNMKIHRFVLYILYILIFMNIFTANNQGELDLRNWAELADNFSNKFFLTEDAKNIGDNCIFYQHESGGFPKNYYYPNIIGSYQKNKIKKHKKDNMYPTIDNKATTTEITYLSKLYLATGIIKYRQSALKGLDFLLNNQYKNGGFAQCPLKKQNTYQKQITFNDNAMINVLKLLKKVSEKSYPFEYIDNETAKRAKTAFDKGIKCILKTQIRQNGKLTAWCQQYDKTTLKPCKARTYELPSINGGKESAEIVLFLMTIKNPSLEVKNSVEGAVEWFEKSKISNIKEEFYMDKNNKYNAKITHCDFCKPMWAKCYDIKTNKPFFADRNGNIVLQLDDIPVERRIGYEWYGYYPQKALDAYKIWEYRKNK